MEVEIDFDFGVGGPILTWFLCEAIANDYSSKVYRMDRR